MPETFNEEIVDRTIEIDVDASYEMSQTMSALGLFAGQSSGAYVWGAYQVAKLAGTGHIVTIFNDIGERYFSTGMWDKRG